MEKYNPENRFKLEAINLRILDEIQPRLNIDNLSDDALELYLQYISFLSFILSGALLKHVYINGKGLSPNDPLLKSISQNVLNESIIFQEKYILPKLIQKSESFSSVNLGKLNTRTDVFAFLLTKEIEYFKELKTGIETNQAFTVYKGHVEDGLIEADDLPPSFSFEEKIYYNFLKDIFCVRIEESFQGITIGDEKDYKMDRDKVDSFFYNLLLEYKSLYFAISNL